MGINILVLGMGSYAFGKEQRAVSAFKEMHRVNPFFLISKWGDGSVSQLLERHNFKFSIAPFGYLGRAKPVWTLIAILHIPQLYFKVIQVYLKRKCSLILLLTIHSFMNAFIPILFLNCIYGAKLIFYLGDTPRNDRIHKSLGWLINKMVKRVIANSRAVKQGLVAIGIDEYKIQVIYNGKDIHKFEDASPIGFRQKYGWGQQSTLVGFIGQLLPNKGVEDFINAAEFIVNNEKNCYFLVIGESTPLFQNFEDEMRTQVNRKGINERVVFTGKLENIERAYADLDIVIVPSRHEDPAPNVNIEAMASGVPVIATRVGGTPELVLDGETGFLVEKGSPEKIGEYILRLIRDTSLRQKMGQRGKERARKMFDIKETSYLVEEVMLNA